MFLFLFLKKQTVRDCHAGWCFWNDALGFIWNVEIDEVQQNTQKSQWGMGWMTSTS